MIKSAEIIRIQAHNCTNKKDVALNGEQIQVREVVTKSLRELGLDEKWLQEQVAANPGRLGLAENTRLIRREKPQPTGGRLDVLLEDEDTEMRYEVEIQLGKTDETHIIRTIEYWDVERKRYTEHNHCAVIIAEEITGRFFNVIGLFNGHIPLIAIKLTAIEYSSGEVGLLFTRVLDAISHGREEEDNAEASSYETWVKLRGKPWVDFATRLFTVFLPESANKEPNYTGSYIAMRKRGKNVLFFVYRKTAVRVEFVHSMHSPEIEKQLLDAGVTPTYNPRSQYYWFSVPIAADLSSSQLPAVMKKILEGGDFGEQEKESNAAD